MVVHYMEGETTKSIYREVYFAKVPILLSGIWVVDVADGS
jgi:hypothetical protein